MRTHQFGWWQEKHPAPDTVEGQEWAGAVDGCLGSVRSFLQEEGLEVEFQEAIRTARTRMRWHLAAELSDVVKEFLHRVEERWAEEDAKLAALQTDALKQERLEDMAKARRERIAAQKAESARQKQERWAAFNTKMRFRRKERF